MHTFQMNCFFWGRCYCLFLPAIFLLTIFVMLIYCSCNAYMYSKPKLEVLVEGDTTVDCLPHSSDGVFTVPVIEEIM